MKIEDYMDLKYLSLNEQDDNEEIMEEVTVSLMSMMRDNREYGPGSMEIDEDITEIFSQEPSDFVDKEEEETPHEVKYSYEKDGDVDLKSKIDLFSHSCANKNKPKRGQNRIVMKVQIKSNVFYF
jgi:hypothetical protein